MKHDYIDANLKSNYDVLQVNEYSSLKEESLYSWADLGPGSFLLRLGGLWLVTFTVLGVPIAAASFNPSKVLYTHTLFF